MWVHHVFCRITSPFRFVAFFFEKDGKLDWFLKSLVKEL